MNSRAAIKVQLGGRVQGVGFRYFTRARALQYRLNGYVRNLPDGSVEVVAVGERELLEAFLGDLRQGPPTGKVDQCQMSWLDPPESYTEFSIRP